MLLISRKLLSCSVLLKEVDAGKFVQFKRCLPYNTPRAYVLGYGYARLETSVEQNTKCFNIYCQ